MEFNALPESKHQEVILRPLAADDLEAWYDYLTMPVVFEHTSWKPESVADLATFMWGAGTWTLIPRLRFAIASRTTGRLGQRGIATSMCSLLVSWAHTHIGVNRIQATALESNDRSIRVLERCGFELEGLLRHYRMVRGAPGNFYMYSHLESQEFMTL